MSYQCNSRFHAIIFFNIAPRMIAPRDRRTVVVDGRLVVRWSALATYNIDRIRRVGARTRNHYDHWRDKPMEVRLGLVRVP